MRFRYVVFTLVEHRLNMVFPAFILQTNKPCKVDRESYDGPVAKITTAVFNNKPVMSENPIVPNNAEFHNRPPTSSGSRNLHDSTFSLSGENFVLF